MSGVDHLANAKDYIAKGEDYYRKAGEEIEAARREGWSWPAIGRELGRSERWLRSLVAYASNPTGSGSPFGGEEENSARYERQARTVLKDPERRQRAMAELPTEQIEDLIVEAHDVARDRMRARSAEHDTSPKAPTVGDLTGGERFDPSEYWSDTLVIRVNRNARELASLMQRAGGLLFGTMTPEQAFDYLYEAERLVAEARAAAMEQSRDRTEV